MVSEANFFAASYVVYHARNWYPEEFLRKKFVDSLKEQFALIAAVATDSMDDAAFRSVYESLLTTREQQYRTIRGVIQDGELFREEPGGTYTPVARVRKRSAN